MAIRDILTVPDPRLKTVSKPVEGGVTDDIRALMDDMLETMYEAPGIGLAAIQVGVPLRVIVMDLSDDRSAPRYFVNPEILDPSETTAPYEEGCLSVPDIFDEVERPDRCRVTYLNYDGEEVIEDAEGLFAVCIQHEMDHLEGTLFIDHLSRLKRERAIEKVRKAKRQKARDAAA
ncbi:MAG: peptide deformylase [Pseudomonadota bacterium]